MPSFIRRRPSPRTATRRRLALHPEALERRVVLTTTQYNLFDTGVLSTGKAIADGASDTHYTVTTNTDGTDATAAIAAVGGPASTATTHWVAPTADQSITEGDPAGNYYYTTTFNVPAGGGNGHISGSTASDDALVDVLVNGVSTGITHPNTTTPTAFSISTALPAGVNTITFEVNNIQLATNNPTELFASGLTLDFDPTVAVDKSAATVVYGGTVTQTGTFGDFDDGDVVTLTSSQGTVTKSTTNPGTFTFAESGVTTSGPVTIYATDSQGNVQSTTLQINVVSLAITGQGTPATAVSGGAAVVINPDVTITAPGLANLTSASVSIGTNFTPGEDQLLFTNQSGITGSYNATTGVLTLSGSATPAEYQAALQSVQYQDTNTNPVTANRASRNFTYVLGAASYNAATGHFYQFIAAPGISWTDAEAAAQASSLFGSPGYLATITSAAENQPFITGGVSGWFAASDAASSGEWIDTDGPEVGTQFWQGFAAGTAVNGQYNNWAPGEPTSTTGANYVTLVNGQWVNEPNDFTVPGYLVEYDGPGSDATQQLFLTSSINVASVSDTPVVTAPSAPLLTRFTDAFISGTADAGSLVQIYLDANSDGQIDDGEVVVGSEQLDPGQIGFGISVLLVPNGFSDYLVTATVGGASESAPAVVPRYTQDSIAPAAPVITSPTSAETLTTTTATITGTAEAGSLVKIYLLDASGKIPTSSIDQVQLAADQTTFSFTVPLTANAADGFVVEATDAAGNVSTPATVPIITQVTTVTVTGRVFLDLNADEILGSNELGFPQRVVFISLDGSGVYKSGDPTTTADSTGAFTFTNVALGLGQPIDLFDQDIAARYAVNSTTTSNGQTFIAVVPYSPICQMFLVPTFVTVNHIATIEAYVQSLYHTVLNRNGSAAELTNWDTLIASESLSPAGIAERFFNSPEHRLDEVIDYYHNFLDRELDPLAQYWVNLLMAGSGEQAVVQGILSSAEYQQAQNHTDASSYVRDLYLDVLGRHAGDSEVNSWLGLMNSGTSRLSVADQFVHSTEADEQLVTSFYVNLLRRQPEGGTSSAVWMNELASGTSAGDVALGILTSSEFQKNSGSEPVGPVPLN